MEMSLILLLLSSLPVSLGAPTSPSQSNWGILKTDNYDDLGQTAPGGALDNAPVLNTDGGVTYSAFQYDTVAIQAAGLKSTSPPNRAFYGLAGTTTQANVFTKGKCVSFKQFDFGCIAALQNNAVLVPVPCSVTVTGRDANDNLVGRNQTFMFTPNGPLLSDMATAIISSANVSKVQSLLFTTMLDDGEVDATIAKALGLPDPSPESLAPVMATIIDNFKYIEYNTDEGCKN